jgi:hypothetical protein
MAISFGEAIELSRPQLKKIPEYNQLQQRRYRNPKGYLSYEKAIDRSCMGLLNSGKLSDFVNVQTEYLVRRVANENCPAYWLASGLQTAILQSDLPEHVIGMRRAIPCGILFLASGGLISPDNEPVHFIYFAHHFKGEVISYRRFGETKSETCEFDFVQWSTIMPSGLVYSSNPKVDQGEGLDLGTYDNKTLLRPLGIQVDESAEDKFIKQISNLLLQTLLLIQTRPEFVEAGQAVGYGESGSNRKQKSNLLINPNWVGKSYQVQKRNFIEPTRTHASPRMHWRRGHHKRVPIGERGKGERKWVWIEPQLINGA